MAVFQQLVRFDRPLNGAAVAGRTSAYDERAIAAIRERAYQEGGEAARGIGNQQLVDFRHEVQHLQDGLFDRLAGVESTIIAQVQAALPGLAIELARRLLAGYEPPTEVVQRHCCEVLEALYPERENLELLISPRDAALLEKIDPTWTSHYPGLRLTADPALSAGDCQVRSRFGVTDARLSSKLETLQRELAAS